MNNQNNFKFFFIEKANEVLLKREKRRFEMDEDNKYALEFFTSYFSDNKALEKLGGKPHKGLFIYGNCGTGKSLFFEILEEVYKTHNNPVFYIKTINTIDLTDKVNGELSRPNQLARNDSSIFESNTRGSKHYEDLGAERKLIHFGNTIEVMSEILQLRYNILKSRGNTFITTNLSPDQVKERYGIRIYDRMFEMFNIIEMQGHSRRK